jgi:hypothetical protein
MRFLRTALTLVAVWCTSTAIARAQDASEAPPPHVAIVDGVATLDREDMTEPATAGAPLVPGDRLRTERGRAEVLFPDGSAIDLDEYSSIELQGPTLLRVTSGRVRLSVAGTNNPASTVQFQIDTPVASAQTDGPGEYRISLLSDPSGLQTEMAVVRGSGALVSDFGTMPLRAGERSVAWDNAAPSRPQIFNSARFDAFDQWALGLRDQRRASRSGQYLPPDLRMYGGQLDRYGAWDYEAPYGYVWYPTVAAEWRPYYDGYWAPVPTYGWTWIGVDVWSWPTHHYGRWGYARSRWFWIPDRRWAPAWVSWGGAPGYVSWCPLGFDNRPVFSLSVSNGNNWRGWTVLSRDHFGGRRNVHQYAVAPRALPGNIGFVAHASAPVAPAYAVPRRGGSGAQVARGRQAPLDGQRVAGDLRQSSGVSRQPGVRERQPLPGQTPQGRQPSSGSRYPQAVSRPPQTFGETQPYTQQRVPDRQPQAISRQPQGAQPPLSRGERPSYDGTSRPTSPSDDRVYSRRRYERPVPAPSQPIAPVAPQAPERPQYGTAMRRSNPVAQPAMPIRPAEPSQSEGTRFSRRGAPAYVPATPPQPVAPPIASAPPARGPQQSQERAAPPRGQEQASPRGQEHQQSQQSSSEHQGGDGGGHSRRR